MPYGGMLKTYSSVWAHWKDMDGKSFRILFGLYLIEEQPTKKAIKLWDKFADHFVSQEG